MQRRCVLNAPIAPSFHAAKLGAASMDLAIRAAETGLYDESGLSKGCCGSHSECEGF